MERLKDLLVSLIMEPGVTKFFRGLLMTLSSAALILGTRAFLFEGRIERAFSRLQTIADGKATLPSPPSLFDHWPIINAMIPETVIGIIGWISLLVAGWMMVGFGRQIERMF